MKRKYVPIDEAIAWGKEFYGITEDCGICAAVTVTNMGYCANGATWYWFDMDGVPCYTLKF